MERVLELWPYLAICFCERFGRHSSKLRTLTFLPFEKTQNALMVDNSRAGFGIRTDAVSVGFAGPSLQVAEKSGREFIFECTPDG